MTDIIHPLSLAEPHWGPTGKLVYERTYQRTMPNGSKETWFDTVDRVAKGNIAFVHGRDVESWDAAVFAEYLELRDYMYDMKVIPAGRHLWATGAPGRQFIMNCHVNGWPDKISEHYSWEFLRLMEGGGVGSAYSTKYLTQYGLPERTLKVHIVCDPAHPDYEAMKAAGILSEDYHHEWSGAFAVEDSREGWADALTDLIDTYWKPGGVVHVDRVYDVSRVRGAGQPLRTFGGTASGPQPFGEMMRNITAILNEAALRLLDWPDHPDNFVALTPLEAMAIDHEIGKCVVSGGTRRSARMAIVAWDDPFIFDFIKSKHDPSQHWTTNISVAIDNEFVSHVQGEIFVGLQDRRSLALKVYEAVVTGMLTNGEPGFWNEEMSQEGEVGTIVATNPCGEITLQEFEPCCIGHVNVDAFAPTPERPYIDWDGLTRAHELMARFLVRATFCDINSERQRDILSRNRRIGVGHFGVQGFLVKNGVKFSEMATATIEGTSFQAILRSLYYTVKDAARGISNELRIPEPIKCTTIAPTGSIAKLAGRSEGLHPIFAKRFIRRVRFSTVDADQVKQVAAFAADGYDVEPDRQAANTVVVSFPTVDTLVAEVEALGLDADSLVESADEISLEAMLSAQSIYQTCYVDNAVSFTVNVPAEAHQQAALDAGSWKLPAPTPERVNAVMKALAPALTSIKGTTLMVDGTRPQSPYERVNASEWEALVSLATVGDGVDEECANGSCPVR